MADKFEKKARGVIALLEQIEDIPGGWGTMMAILQGRGIRNTLVDARRQKGITQKQLAELMDVPQSRISELENERWPDPKISTLARWAHALDLELNPSVYTRPPEVEDQGEGTGTVV